MIVRFLSVLFAGLVLAPASLALAQPLPVVVRIDDPDDRLLLERVRGQTNDLDVQIETDSGRPLEPSLAEQLRTARTLTESRRARVAVWFVRDDSGLTVHVSEPGAGRVLVRRLEHIVEEGQGTALSASADSEAVALLVRSALRALAAGGEIGVSEKEVAPAPSPTPPVSEAAPARPPAPPPAWQLDATAGWHGALDGVSGAGQHAFVGAVTLRRGMWSAGVRGGVGLSSTLQDELASVQLARHHAVLRLGVSPWSTDTWQLDVALGCGAALYTQAASARTDNLRAAPDTRRVLALLQGELSLGVLPPAFGGWFGLSLAVGVDALPRVPELGYTQGGQFRRWDRLHAVQPRGGLSLLLRMR